jgi:acyl carrier protein
LNNPVERQAVLANVMKEAAGLTQDCEREFAAPIAPETRLVADLGCQSLDIIVLIAQLSRQLQRNDIPFERLFLANGKPVSDVTVGALADFLWEQTQGVPT